MIGDMLRVAIQGYRASFHEAAALQYFGPDIEIVECESFPDVFAALPNCDYAVVAVRNTGAGEISESLACIARDEPTVVEHITLPITQCLVGVPGAKITDVREIYSHPVAIAQCLIYLAREMPKAALHETADTAKSVADIKRWNNPRKAAIASEFAADFYGMPVLARGIESALNNATTFAILQPKSAA